MKKQIELLKKYGINNYTVENNVTTINGYLDLSSITSADKDFLKGTTINGYLYLSSITSADKDFLKGTTINGSLDLSSITSADKDFLPRSNVKQLKEGYNEKLGYCFFDGILSKVISVHARKGYNLYKTPFEFIAQKGKYTAHGKTIKKAIEDLEFKFIVEKLKNDPIKEDTVITIQYYRGVTGACESGVKYWMQQNNITKEKYKASELLPLLEKTNAYGLDRFKSLITF